MKFSEMNQNQKQVFLMVVDACNEYIGGWENSMMDSREGSEDWLEAKKMLEQPHDTLVKWILDDIRFSREELVAEIGSAMLCTHVGIRCEKAFRNSVAYIQGWAQKLKDDNKAIIWAASRAERAAKYILNINDNEQTERT